MLIHAHHHFLVHLDQVIDLRGIMLVRSALLVAIVAASSLGTVVSRVSRW